MQGIHSHRMAGLLGKGPILVADVASTLADVAYPDEPYVGVLPILKGAAAMGVPIVYVAPTGAEQRVVENLPAGSVESEGVRGALESLQQRYPAAHFFVLGNDGGADAAASQGLATQTWIRNVRADQANIPPGFQGVIRDVYSPDLIANLLGTLRADLNGMAPVAPLGDNAPPGLPPTKAGSHWLETLAQAARLAEGWAEERLRGGLDPVGWVEGQSDTALSKLTADNLAALANRVGERSADTFMRLVMAHGGDAGHVAAVLHGVRHPIQDPRLSSITGTDLPARPGDWEGFEAYLDSATATQARPGSKVDPLINGQEAFPRMLEAIDRAQRRVDWSVYAFQSDQTGWEVARHLGAAADRGCQVRLLYDVDGSKSSNGASTDPKIYDFLKAHGVQIIARPDRALNTEKTHRKLLVLDGEVGFLGGMNVGNEYANEWHDVQARVTGPAVADMSGLFEKQWETEGGAPAEGLPMPAAVSGSGARLIGHDGRNDQNMKLAYLRAIDTAEKTINIANPYFADTDVLEHLKKAVQRGVTVNLVLPHRNDLPMLQAWERDHYREMLSAGLHVFEYHGREMAHDKVATFDGKVSTIGSSNLDQESLFANFEANLWSNDSAVAADLDKRLFEADEKQSYPITEYHEGALAAVKGQILRLLQKNWL
ncbi:MAG TPA: phosphatidylserine/phosphatidylglycerophosphate/cardiolipin synthase family protein [Candidatus Xenobia bacterium]